MVRGSLLMLLAGLSLLSTRIGSSLVLKRFLPGSYTNLPLSLVPKLLGLPGWLSLLRLLLLSVMLMSLLLSRAGLPSVSLLELLWLLWGTCAGSDFVVGVASLIITLEILACSCIWQLFGLVLVALD